MSEFIEAAALIDSDGLILSQAGLNEIFSVMEHLEDGGTLENFKNLSRSEVICMLAAVWVTSRNHLQTISEENGEWLT